MELSEEKRPIKNDIPDEIMIKVSSFPSMPGAGIKLRALLAEEDVSMDEIEGILRHDRDFPPTFLGWQILPFLAYPEKLKL